MAIDGVLLSSQFNLLSTISQLGTQSFVSGLKVNTNNPFSKLLFSPFGSFNQTSAVGTGALNLALASQPLLSTSSSNVLDDQEITITADVAGDEDALTATANTLATLGDSYEIEISQLAQEQKTQSASVNAGAATPLAPGTYDFDITPTGGGPTTPISVTVNPGDTNQDVLDAVASQVNAQPGYTSAVIDVGGGNIKLNIFSADTGEDFGFTISDTTGTLANTYQLDSVASVLTTDPGGGTFQAAQNAEFTVDGIPQEDSTNTPTIDGGAVQLELLDTTSGPVTVEVTSNSQQVVDAVKDFVDAFNEQLANLSAGGFNNGLALSSLQSAAATNAGALSQIGISVGTGGTLTINESDLEEAAQSNIAGIQEAFQGPTGLATKANEAAATSLATPLLFNTSGNPLSLFGGNSPFTQFGLSSSGGLNTLFFSNIGYFLNLSA